MLPTAEFGWSIPRKNPRLVDPSQKPIDICIFREIRAKSNLEGCLLFCEPDAWLEKGRPRELSSLPLAAWSFLLTSVKEYQIKRRKIHPQWWVWISLLTYCVYEFAMGVSVMAFEKGKMEVAALFWTVACCDLFFVSHGTAYFVWRRYERSSFHRFTSSSRN